MNIVMANKYYYMKGGAERYMLDLTDLLVEQGHAVVPFAMKDGRNISTHWSDKFVSPVQTERVSFGWQGLRTAGRMLYSFEAQRKFGSLLDEVRPDVVHLQNIYHQISPSILPEAKSRGIPVVMTAHDYALIAPNYALFHDGRICEHTRPDNFFAAVKHRCVKGSHLASAWKAFEMHFHRWLGLWRNNIDKIIAPSAFMAAMLEEYGIDGTKIVQLPYYIDANQWHPHYGGDYALYVGRLSAEKGVDTLIRAAAMAKDVPVRIVGTGPEDMRLHRLAEELGADNVTFVGWKSGEALRHEYAKARFLVVTSPWYEVFGLIIFEAYASGKPVISTHMGGLGEIVRDGQTGLLTSAGDADDLAERLAMLWHSPDRCQTMGRQARHWLEAEFTPEMHYRRLMDIYESAGASDN